MIAEILSIGTELLLGQIVNSDAQYLSKRLSEMGIDLYYHVTVGDNAKRLCGCLETALSRSDMVITTGGLGPTQDDLTKETIAKYMGLAMVPDPESEIRLRAHFEGSGREMTPNNLRQVFFPKGCIILKNDYGTAPGCIVERDGKCIIVLPGPPRELQGMFQDQVLPYLQNLSRDVIYSKMLKVFGLGESTVEHLLRDIIENQLNPTIAPYASFGEMSLRLTVKCKATDSPEKLLAPLEAQVRGRLGDYVYATGEDTMQSATVHALAACGKTVATAESCTGGLIASMLVAVPGASDVFEQGYITYSDLAKQKTLGVLEETLQKYGAVSSQTAKEMANGSRERSGSDYGLAVTGIAGPGGGTAEKPVGLVYIALAHDHGAEVLELRLTGNRDRIRRMTALQALNMLRKQIVTNI